LEQERIDILKGLFKGPLLNMKENILMMAGLTDRNLNLSLGSLIERNDHKAELVEAEDEVIDKSGD
jgi:phosphate uptake regulator